MDRLKRAALAVTAGPRVPSVDVPRACRPKATVWQVIEALEQHGYARLVCYDALAAKNPYALLITSPDPHIPSPPPIPLACVAYDDERGLYDTRLADPHGG